MKKLMLLIVLVMTFLVTEESHARSKPTIVSVMFSGTRVNLGVDIKGAGFGVAPVSMPYTGCLRQFSFIDNTTFKNGTRNSFEAGHIGDWVTLRYESWTDNEIVIDGFSGAYGSWGWRVSPNDKITIHISRDNSNDRSDSRTVWNGFLLIVPRNAPVDYSRGPIMVAGFIVLGLFVLVIIWKVSHPRRIVQRPSEAIGQETGSFSSERKEPKRERPSFDNPPQDRDPGPPRMVWGPYHGWPTNGVSDEHGDTGYGAHHGWHWE